MERKEAEAEQGKRAVNVPQAQPRCRLPEGPHVYSKCRAGHVLSCVNENTNRTQSQFRVRRLMSEGGPVALQFKKPCPQGRQRV